MRPATCASKRKGWLNNSKPNRQEEAKLKRLMKPPRSDLYLAANVAAQPAPLDRRARNEQGSPTRARMSCTSYTRLGCAAKTWFLCATERFWSQRPLLTVVVPW